MTNSQMFKAAHAGAKADMEWAKSNPFFAKPYAYFFRLRLLQEQRTKLELTAKLVRGFQIVEPRRLWA